MNKLNQENTQLTYDFIRDFLLQSTDAIGLAGLPFALTVGAVAAAGAIAGGLLGGELAGWAWSGWTGWRDYFNLNRDGKYHIVDPLALDLDGNGIQTIATAGFSGSLFDHNKDGIRTATGWVASGDGLLVRDLNGNGQIDNGGELFS